MSSLQTSLINITRDLDSLRARWAIVGGLAVSARAEPRLTRDVDIAVGVANDAEAETMIAALRALGYEPQAVVEQTATGRLATVRLVPRDSKALVDLLFASSGIEDEIVARAERLELLPGLVMPVALRSHLIVLKLLARDDRSRPQDWDDLRALTALASPHELADARDAARLVAARGFARGRDLIVALDELLAG